MSTTVVSLFRHSQKDTFYTNPEEQWRQRRERRSAVWLVTALAALAFFIHGYHPFAEDGGLYLTGVKKLLSPNMFPHETGFVVEHLRFSIFAPTLALIAKTSGIKLEPLILLTYFSSIWATLWAGWLLAERCFQGLARISAVALFATWLTLPVAGTSLMVMDPYVTARSISTPCMLLALVFALDFLVHWQRWDEYNGRALIKMGGMLVIAAFMHPLMAAYGFGCILALGTAISLRRKTWFITTAGLCIAALAVAVILGMVAQPETANYRQVAMSRYYWFLAQWHWYEWLGLAGPLAILGYAGFVRQGLNRTAVSLARMCVAAGVSAGLVALIFAREDSATLLVARLQPLRVFQTIYIVMILFVGAWLSTQLGNNKVRWAALFAILAGAMFLVQRETFPASAHIELSPNQQSNDWTQAFAWIRNNTPSDSLFALDADYITKPGEDAQSFRAIAERSALPDYSKDGGEAAITPSLTEDWMMGQRLQKKLSEQNDQQRLAALRPIGVGWIVLTKNAVTGFSCDYANTAVKVCRLPIPASGIRVSSNTRTSLLPISPNR